MKSIQKHIIGCWKRHFNIIQLTNSKNKSLIWIYRWTRWATHWRPAQFRRVGSLHLNRTRVDGSGLLTTRTANLAVVRFGPRPGPEVTVRNRCLHYASPYGRPLAFECLPYTLLNSLLDSLFETDTVERAALWEDKSVPPLAFGRLQTLSSLKLWLIEGSKCVKALDNRRLWVCGYINAKIDIASHLFRASPGVIIRTY